VTLWRCGLTGVSNNGNSYIFRCGPGSSVGIETDYRLDDAGIGSLWGRDFPRLSRPALGLVWTGGTFRRQSATGACCWPFTTSSAEVMEENSCNCTHSLGNTWPVTGLLYLFFYLLLMIEFESCSVTDMLGMFVCNALPECGGKVGGKYIVAELCFCWYSQDF
jgi:hypothetical protein